MEEKVGPNPSPRSYKQLFWLMALVAAFFGAIEAAGWIAGQLNLAPLAATSLGQMVILLVALIFVAADGGGFRPLGVTTRWQGFDVGMVPIIIGVHFIGSIITSIILLQTGALDMDTKAIGTLVKQFANYDAGQFTLIALGLSLQAGIGEELLFRGYLITRLERLGLPGWLVIPISALAFGLAHTSGYGIAASLSKALWFGVPTGIYFWFRRNLGPLVLAHSLMDFVTFMLMFVVLKLGNGLLQ